MSKWMQSVLLGGLLLGLSLYANETEKQVLNQDTKGIYEVMEKLKKGEKVILKGAVFYSEPLRFDYDKDGVKNSVVMASKFFIKQKPDKTYDGYIQRYLYDIDKKKPVSWYAKKNMLQEPPVGVDTSISNVAHEGKTVKFNSGTWHFTMTDGGAGYISDKIIVNDGIRTKQVIMFGGDIEVFSD